MRVVRISEEAHHKFSEPEFRLFLKESFEKPKAKYLLKAYSTKEQKIYLAAREEKRILGAIIVCLAYGVARIGVFITRKGYRQTGIGSKLLPAGEKIAERHGCKKIWVWTFDDIPAHRFYLKHGYHEEARLKKHFGGMKDLVVMSKFL